MTTTHITKTLIQKLTHHPLTLCRLLSLLLYNRNLMTLLKKNIQIFQKWSKFNCKLCCWWLCSTIWNTNKNYHSVTSLCSQGFTGTTTTHKSLMRNFITPVKNFLHQEKNLFVFKNMAKVLMLHSVPKHVFWISLLIIFLKFIYLRINLSLLKSYYSHNYLNSIQ